MRRIGVSSAYPSCFCSPVSYWQCWTSSSEQWTFQRLRVIKPGILRDSPGYGLASSASALSSLSTALVGVGDHHCRPPIHISTAIILRHFLRTSNESKIKLARLHKICLLIAEAGLVFTPTALLNLLALAVTRHGDVLISITCDAIVSFLLPSNYVLH